MTDLYEALGVGRDAKPDDIRKAYRRASKKAHPDAGGSPDKFALIKTAADVLGDDERRRHYDATGKIDEKPQDKSMTVVITAIDTVMNEIARRGLDPETVDVISDAKKALKIQIANMDEAHRKAAKQIADAKKLIKRFKSKKGKPNRIAPMIEAKIRQAEYDAGNILKDKPSLVVAIDILSDHTYDWTEPDGYGDRSASMMSMPFILKNAS